MIFGTDIDAGTCFAPDFAAARVRFLEAAHRAGARIRSYPIPAAGPRGEPLATDTAWIGPDDADDVLVLVSATHGVEGFCGSAAQVDALRAGAGRHLAPGQALLAIHALNPHGFAWLRRVTEEGIDLNRNGIDFSAGPPPRNPGYDELADAFVPGGFDDATLAAAVRRLDAYRLAHGAVAFETARSCGQHSHPQGIFYGGVAPAAAMRTLMRVVDEHGLPRRRRIAVIDYHSGLGPFGHGEPICGHRPGEPGQARCRSWYGSSLGEPLLGTSASLPIAGLSQYAWSRSVGSGRLVFVAIEFGTFDRETGAEALRDDHVLHALGPVDWQAPQTRRIKAALRRFYHPDTTDWCEMVLFRSRQLICQALDGMAREAAGAAPAESAR
jgi:hypothetical protein